MKAKKIYIIMICLLILSSCRSNKNSNPNNTSSTQNNSATISKNIKDPETKNQKKDEDLLTLNTKYSTKDFELTINSYELTNLIEPEKKDSYYTYYENKNLDTSKFLVVHGIFKNLSGDSVLLENFASQIVINDKYKYDLQSLYKDDGDLQSFANINPLEEKEIILFSEIPNEAIHKKEKIVFKFGYNTDQDNNMYYSLESREHIVTYDLDKQ